MLPAIVLTLLTSVLTSPDGTLSKVTPTGGYTTPLVITDTGSANGRYRHFTIGVESPCGGATSCAWAG